ncbi:hypothetical protein BC826DRAFT_1090616 [Russula brevipes]|nr:hypothetical protein BC826DRAFT_1090616 [Russula brevipes]
MATEPRNAQLFKEWLASHGGSFHPAVRYSPGRFSSGLSILASEAIEPDATIVTCPFSIIITPLLSKGALLPILQDASVLGRWTERQLIIVYLCFHWITGPEIHETLIHSPYLDTLPLPSQLRTPLHFTKEETDALRGTNVYGATLDRRRVWEAEWEQCRADVSAINAEWGDGLTWERFLTASTYLSSRAFPSTLLSPSPTLVQRPDSHPVLIPGVDALNHARGQPVSWVVSSCASAPPPAPPPAAADAGESGGCASISLVTHGASKAGAEIFNNYGAKPNSELLLGYGFTLRANPDDTIVLKVGGRGAVGQQQHEVGRGARGAESVWGTVLDAVKAAAARGDEGDDDSEVPDWQIVLEGADVLRAMTESLLEHLPGVPELENPRPPREEVAGMIGDYISGQREVLQDLLGYANDREMGGVAMARREGTVIRLGGDEDDDDDVLDAASISDQQIDET